MVKTNLTSLRSLLTLLVSVALLFTTAHRAYAEESDDEEEYIEELVVTGVAAATPRVKLPFTVEKIDFAFPLIQTSDDSC